MTADEAREVLYAIRRKHRFAQDYGMRREYMDCECGERVLVLGADDPWDVFERHRTDVLLAEPDLILTALGGTRTLTLARWAGATDIDVWRFPLR